MPWNPSEATSKTKKANTSSKKATWSKVANSVLSKSGDDAKAIKIANAAMRKIRG